MAAEYAIASSAANVNIAALINPRASPGGTKFRSVVAMVAMRMAKLSHFWGGGQLDVGES